MRRGDRCLHRQDPQRHDGAVLFQRLRHPGRPADLSHSGQCAGVDRGRRAARRHQHRRGAGGDASQGRQGQRSSSSTRRDETRSSGGFARPPRGLAAIDAPEGTLAMYSAAPGKVINDGPGPTSLFVSELIKEMRAPNLTAEEVFNRARIGVSRASNNEQVPWVASSLVDEFYFGQARPASATSTPVPAPVPPSPSPPSPPPTPRPRRPAPAPAPAPTPPPPVVVTPAPTPARRHRLQRPRRNRLRTRRRRRAGTAAAGLDQSRRYVPRLRVIALNWSSCRRELFRWVRRPNSKIRCTRSRSRNPSRSGRYEVTFEEWDQCVEEGGCKHKPDDRELGPRRTGR